MSLFLSKAVVALLNGETPGREFLLKVKDVY
jgi:hypothetical protein